MIPTFEVITFPPIEPVGILRLSGALTNLGDDALVSDTIPSPDRPGRIVKVTAGGPSSRPNLVTTVRSTILECWDVDRDDAANLCERVYAIAMATRGSVGDAWVRYMMSVGEPTYFPDPRTDLPRYQCTVSFALAPTTN
ncbi:hypothetical protein CH296_00390 [Rhodococcus sp. 14-2496-1d]|uniref:hypothetical protein n=1 Tax=Rhodococcus sp. 14-2496-1d TaxID=2023146 RepID=UPI000B9C3177|nr:hypothetical protein [Rhodococcus sp. 14-2496-1d]OZF40750.1 hypothetical protein CH296_00390 [Rhodococcus sp. 14-2496-1d]